jgi:chromosome segregation ATPase
MHTIFLQHRSQLQEKQAETVELMNQFRAADNDYNEKKEILKKLHNDAETIAPMAEWRERLDRDDVPVTLEEVEDALDEAENKVNSITDNPHVMRQYEERRFEIARLKDQLEDAGSEKDMKNKQLDQKLEIWESQLINIVKKVSEKFSSYMKEVGCAGEVRLYTGGKNSQENNDGEIRSFNFKDWGIEILVKFREASSLQVLSAQTHSGGERSVSTIMYLMGLQNLMLSPFRCVDEINQGLDERNERFVFKRIVENSTVPANSSNNDHCGQYFLITPKLLPNLEGMENENITVLFVFSGPHNFSNCLDWNVDKFVEDKMRFQTNNITGKKRKSN